MNVNEINSEKYQQCLVNSKKVNWDIDTDVIRFRQLETRHKFLPDGLSLVEGLPFLNKMEQRLFSQIQGRTYCYLFALVERFINTKMIELSLDHALGDQVALEALVQFSSEEIKHQELFSRLESMAESLLPPGYMMAAKPNEVAAMVLKKSTWSVLALTCHIEIFTQYHYRESIHSDSSLSPLFKDVFKYHWMEESQHARLDELEWDRINLGCNDTMRDQYVEDLISLVVAIDNLLQSQSQMDANYFMKNCDTNFSSKEKTSIAETFLGAYRWQYIVSGVGIERFQKALFQKINAKQKDRIMTALNPLICFVEDIRCTVLTHS